MDGKSLDITEERINKLKEILPEAFTEGKIDWEKLQASLGEDIEFKNERYVLNWAGKSDAFRVLQSPTTATLVPCKEESIGFDDTENIFIEGENLEVLKVLQKSYFGKIKMIYIDPPYNTGNDKFIYPDKFSETRDEYLSRIGDKDETGYMTREGLFRTNSKDSGHYHSNWLSMMYPRLFLARNLLGDDGVIFVSIDDHEMHNLRLLMNEIFGEENFVATIIWQKVFSPKNTAMHFSEDHDYIICFSKNKEVWLPELLPRSQESLSRYTNPDNDPRGIWMSGAIQARNYYSKGQYEVVSPSGKRYSNPKGTYWRFSKEKFLELDKDNRIWWGESGDNVPRLKRFLSEVKQGVVPQTLWKYDDVGHTQEAKEELIEFVEFEHNENVLNSVKPSRLIKKILQIGTNTDEKDIVLDFFAGSAPTAHGTIMQNLEDEGNRKFLLVQIPESLPQKEKNVKTIADLGKSRIRNVIKKIKDDKQTRLDIGGNTNKQDLGFKVFKLQQSNFKVWRSDIETEEELFTQLTLHTDPVDENAKIENILYELLLKSGVPLTVRIEEKDGYYWVNDGEIALILKRIDEGIIKAVISEKPKKVITLDRLFKNNDQLKTNTALQMKDSEVDFRVL